jgi:hypothetical protein
MSLRRSTARLRVAGMIALLALTPLVGAPIVACGLVGGPKATTNMPAIRLRLRFTLLASFAEVANAAGAELKSKGATQREVGGDDSVTYVVGDEEGVGEDQLQLREAGGILVVDFTLHRPTDDLGGKSNPPSPKNPGAGLGGAPHNGPLNSNDPSAERSAAAQRFRRIVKTLVCLPGVGDLVDQDGVPKEQQLNKETDLCKASARPASPPIPNEVADGGVLDAALTDGSRDAASPTRNDRRPK